MTCDNALDAAMPIHHTPPSDESLDAQIADLKADLLDMQGFNAAITHELRGALRAVSGHCWTLDQALANGPDSDARRSIERLRLGVSRMEEIVEGLMVLSQVQNHDVVWGTVDLSAIAGEIAAEFAERAPDHRVEMLIEPGLSCRGDHRLLRIALQNLIGNAWRYTSKAAAPRIEFKGFGITGTHKVFRLDDNGIGFERCDAKRLFGWFQRIHSEEGFDGTGVGLATAKRAIDRQGGRIWANGRPGAGATFFFLMPVD